MQISIMPACASVVYVRMNYVVEYAVKEKRHPFIVQMVHPYLFLASRLANCTVHADVLGASSGFMGLLPKLQITSGFFTRDTAVTTKLQLDGHLELQWTCLRVVLFFTRSECIFFCARHNRTSEGLLASLAEKL